MIKAFSFCVVFSLSFSYTFGQSEIKGLVSDSLLSVNMANTAVLLLNKADSFLVATARTDSAGNFLLSGIGHGSYIVLVSSASYADFTELVTIAGTNDHIDLGRINMMTRFRLLQEVVVRGVRGSISIRGDTTSYIADSFHLKAGASVEELLKRLPGMTVDKDGKITAQGETVKKILVDGEEFFGDDPALVTRNLRANMIDRVQLYDKRSDLSIATGINDGIKDKTINLKLKESSKKGYFGDATASGGLNGFYENQAMINLFKDKRKISIYGTWANTGRIGLGRQDNEKENVSQDESVTRDSQLDTWSGNYEGRGIPNALAGGAHFGDSWNEGRQAANLNYGITRLNIEGNNDVIALNNLPGETIYSHTGQTFKNFILKNKLTADSQIKPDSVTTVKLNISTGMNHKTTDDLYLTSSSRGDSALLNDGSRRLATSGNLGNFNANFLISRILPKKGRSISLNLHENYIDQNIEGYLNSINNFYIGGRHSAAIIDQRKTDVSRSLYLDGSAGYTELLSRSLLVSVSYRLFINTSDSKVNSYNKSTDGKYDFMDSIYSNNFQFDQRIHQVGVTFNYNTNKVHFNYGADLGFANLIQTNRSTGNKFYRNFLNWHPSAELSYVIRLQKSISVYYQGNAKMPSINQLQPVVNINDPLNIYVGNQELSPSYTNVLGVKYNSFRSAGQQYLFSNFNYSFSGNQISTNVLTDSSGKSIYQYINVGGNSNYWGYLGVGEKIGVSDINVGVNINVNGGENVNYSNGIKNRLKYNTYGYEMYANKYKADWYDMGIKLITSYNTNRSSLQNMAAVNYWLYTIAPDVTIFIPSGIQVHSDFNYQIRQKTPVYNDNLNVFLWNAWISKRLIKDGSLLIKLSANDLLNQNKGVSRSVSGNFIMQNTYSTVRQFFLLSVHWNFTYSTNLSVERK